MIDETAPSESGKYGCVVDIDLGISIDAWIDFQYDRRWAAIRRMAGVTAHRVTRDSNGKQCSGAVWIGEGAIRAGPLNCVRS